MGLPPEDCPKTNRPYISFTTTTSSTTTVWPTIEYLIPPVDDGSICPVDPCICGSLLIPKGLKYGNEGSTLIVGNNTHSLLHPSDVLVDKGQSLITTSTKLISNTILQTDNVTINLGRSVNLIGVVRVIVKIYETKKIIGQLITGSFNESALVSFFRVNLIDTFNLANLTLQVEISSLCKNSKEVCCDRLPSSLQFTNVITNITCSTTTTTTTTTTTIPPTTTTTTTFTSTTTTTTTTDFPTTPPPPPPPPIPNCCDWDGETFIRLSTECDNIQEDIKFLRLTNYLWELDTTLACGDKINALVKCKPEVDYTGLDSCKNKWEVVSFSFPCAQNARMTGNLLEPCDCNKAPIFEFTADNFNNCKCCYQCSISQSINEALPFTPYNPNCNAPPLMPHKVIIPSNYNLPVLININGGINDDLLIDNESITTDLNLDPGPYPDTVGAGCVGAHNIGSKDGPFRDLVNGGITFPINKREFTLACRDSIGAGASININVTINPFGKEACDPQVPFIFKL